MRPGVMIAAAGQFVLLLGIVALTLQSRRSASGQTGVGSGLAHGSAVAAQPVVAGTVPYLPLGASHPWSTATSAGAGHGHQSGQIAQLKAQLACLAQQLDHLDG
jgi:hypothetical protein